MPIAFKTSSTCGATSLLINIGLCPTKKLKRGFEIMEWINFEEIVPVNLSLKDANLDCIIDMSDVEINEFEDFNDAGEQRVEMVFCFTDETQPFRIRSSNEDLTLQAVFGWVIRNAGRFSELTKDQFTNQLDGFARGYRNPVRSESPELRMVEARRINKMRGLS